MAKDVVGTRTKDGKLASFPIVGVGASAGGLEAFTQLLKHLPLDTGMGFVLIQHLDPEHESALTQILSRATRMPVREITNNEQVQANHVYVIPRDANLTIVQGILKIHPRPRTRAPNRPINTFFESLGADQREQAIGVVLSGTATDGTLGLEAIKAEGGLTFAQDDSAKYESMPRSAIAAGCVDLVLSPEAIAQELARIAKHPYVIRQGLEVSIGAEDDRAEATAHQDDSSPLPVGGNARSSKQARGQPSVAKGFAEEDYKKILLLLRNRSGVDFSLYKSTTIQRRITRRLVLNKQETLRAYATFLQGNPKELDALCTDVLISVTSFFRNPETFDALRHEVFPKLLHKRGDNPVRVWVLGCSTGQEAFSIAMAFVEASENVAHTHKLQVFATDLNEALLDKARQGLYAKSLADEISPERLRRFFIEDEGGYRISKMLREMVVFARQNLISDPPFSRMDLVSCRNLLIYLEPSLQRKAIPTFHYALRPGGFLLLGASESIGNFTDLFEPVDKKHKIYSKKAALTPAFSLPLRREHTELPPTSRKPPLAPLHGGEAEQAAVFRSETSAQREADRITVNQFGPPGVLINDQLQILQFRGSTGQYLQPPAGKATFDVLKMAREDLMLPLRALIKQAKKENKTARREKVRVRGNGKAREVNLEVIPLKNLRERCFLILFKEPRGSMRQAAEAGDPHGHMVRLNAKQRSNRIAELENQLSETREYLQSIQEHHEAANEELQASNEEVQSSNEELQSVNEELETSKEELESANEELTTVNEEMSNRNVELNRLNNDLVNLQHSTRLAIILVGRDLTIRRFSPQAAEQFGLMAIDLGRPISHLRHNLVLDDDVGSPLDVGRISSEVIAAVREQESDVRDKGGGWYSLRVRPYVTLDNKVDGAVLTLVGINELKQIEQEIAAARDYAEDIVETVREPLLVLDSDLRVESANRSFYRAFGVGPRETVRRRVYEIGNRQWDIPRLRELLEEILAKNTTIEDFQVEHNFEQIGRRAMLLNARLIPALNQKSGRILLAIEDITERNQAEQARAKLAAIVESSDDAIFSKDLHGVITSWNAGAQRLFGYSAEEAIGQPGSMLIPPDREDEEPRILELIRHGESTTHYETVRRRKDGSTVDISLTVSPIKDAQGRVTGASKIAREITERKAADKERERSLAREGEARRTAENANRVKDEFLAVVTHELRTPLSAILGWSNLLRQRKLSESDTSQALESIERNARGQAKLIEDLVDASRIVVGKLRLDLQRADLVDVIEEAINTVRHAANAKEIQISFNAESRPAPILGDPVRLEQVFWNLLTNSVKFTPPQGRIDVRLERNDSGAQIVVHDTGEGIEPEFMPYIFQRFRQADGSMTRKHGGMGLGLAIVRQLVELHGGAVWAESQGKGHGAKFIVQLPLGALQPDASASVVSSAVERGENQRESGPAVSLENVRVLAVDDEPDTRGLLSTVFKQYGAEVKTAASGEEAFVVLQAWQPDVLVCDIAMPHEDGYVFIRKLRQFPQEQGGEIPALALTAYGRDEDRQRALATGYQAHLRKPAVPAELVSIVNRLVRREKTSAP